MGSLWIGRINEARRLIRELNQSLVLDDHSFFQRPINAWSTCTTIGKGVIVIAADRIYTRQDLW
jgi:hypothetical protein